MANFDWNGDGKKDFWDDMMQLDLMERQRRSNPSNTSFTEEEKGCLSTIWGCFCIIFLIAFVCTLISYL